MERRYRILVVDTDRRVGERIADALDVESHDVIAVQGGIDAIELLHVDDAIDMVVADVAEEGAGGMDVQLWGMSACFPFLPLQFSAIPYGSPIPLLMNFVNSGNPNLLKDLCHPLRQKRLEGVLENPTILIPVLDFPSWRKHKGETGITARRHAVWAGWTSTEGHGNP